MSRIGRNELAAIKISMQKKQESRKKRSNTRV